MSVSELIIGPRGCIPVIGVAWFICPLLCMGLVGGGTSGLAVPIIRASLVVQTVKNLPAMQGTGVRSLGWENPLEKGMATYSIILAWKIPWTEESGRAAVHVVTNSRTRMSNEPFHFS